MLAFVAAAQHVVWREVEWSLALPFALMDWAPWIVISPVVLWFSRHVQIDSHNWLRTIPLHIAAALLVAVAVQAAGQFAIKRQWVAGPQRPPPMRNPEFRRYNAFSRPSLGAASPFRQPAPPPRLIRARFSIPIYCMLVAAAHAIAYHRRSLERERRALSAEAGLSEARLMALQTQLNPHFLFNTLNAVSSFIYTQPHAADEMICALSALLRRVLEVADRREVTLGEELQFTDWYVQIQRIRFADRLEVRYDVAPGIDRINVPTLILQPLVENAILHGTAKHVGRGTVTIHASTRDGRLILAVSDTGNGDAPETPLPPMSERVGLANTRARLAALYDGDAQLSLSRASEGGVCARIGLPLRQTATT